MKYEFYKKDEIVFHINTAGTKFYIILEGIADVYIPKDRLKISAEQAKELLLE